MMRTRPYHHGDLRGALLDAAERSITERGVERLSLRELARTVGVSHGAPRAHFPDRQALLEALSERGFARLGRELRAAHQEADPTFQERVRATIAGYVAFAAANPALLELMFALKPRSDAPELQAAAVEVLSVVPRLIDEGIAAGALAPGDAGRYALVLAAIIRGVVGLVVGNAIGPDAIDQLIADATTTFTRGSAPPP